MRLRDTRGFKVGLWLLTAACLGGAGFLGYKTFFAAGSSARELKSADAAYARGLEAYEKQNWPEAVTRFDEAKLLTDKALDSLKVQATEKKVTVEEAEAMAGRILWLKARAIRDHGFAKSQVDGKPLPETPDPVYKETFRAFVMIPDPEARQEAIHSLREAGKRLAATEPDVLKEALRLELVLSPIEWNRTEPLLRKVLEKDPNDARAHYFLARFEYEQPGDNHITPTPLDRKSADGVDRARDHLAAAKKSTSGFWRNAGLETEIMVWPIRTATARKLKPDVVAAAEKALDQMLFDAQTGLLAVAARGDKLNGLGRADAQGMVSVLGIGYERAVADASKTGSNSERVKFVARAALDLANKMAKRLTEEPSMRSLFPDIVGELIKVTAQSQSLIALADPSAWREQTTGIDNLIKDYPDGIKGRAHSLLGLGEIAATDAAYAARSGDTDRVKELNKRALQLVDDGLKAAEVANLPAAEVDSFHAMLAEWKLQIHTRAEDVEPHLARLRASTIPRARLIGQLLDAQVAERQGRLEQARKLLEPLASDKVNTDLAFRANALLGGIAIATGDLAAALPALRDVEARYNSTTLHITARLWADALLGGGDGIAATLVGVNLGVAQQAAAKYARDNPGKTIPPELVSGYITTADTLLKKLRPPSVGYRIARMAVIAYQTFAGQLKEAQAGLDSLATDYPESLEVLRMRCQFLISPTEPGGPINRNGIAAADLLIRKFTKDYQTDKAARIYFAEWYVRTGRPDEAVKYLTDPQTFPSRDATANRILAIALVRVGKREQAEKIVSELPGDAGIDATLLQVLGTREANEKRIKEALGRYEDQGMLRIYDASMNLSEGKYQEAVRGFASAVEFTRVRRTAQAGIQRALIAYAEADPHKARDEAIRLAAQMPDETGVFIAAALASLLLEEIGSPEDNWDVSKTMHAALNRWESTALKGGAKPVDVVPVRVQFRLLAGDTNGARREAANGLNRNPDHVRLTLMMAELSLLPPADPVRAREFHDAAKKLSPADPRLPFIDASIKTVAGDTAGAAAVYEKLVTAAPKNAALHQLLVSSLVSAGKKDDALRWTQTWAERFPDDSRATIQLINLLVGAGKKPDAVKVGDTLVAKAVADARKKLNDVTPPLTTADIEKRIEDVRGGAILAVASGFLRAGALDEAYDRVKEVQKSFPTSDRVLLMVGDVAIARKSWDEAALAYHQVVKAHSRHFIAGNNLAWILAEKKNDPKAALAIVEEVRKGRIGEKPIGPERLPADFLDTIGVIYLKLGAEKAADMRSVFEVAVQRYPNDPRMYLYLGHALAEIGVRSRALEMFERATSLASGKNALPEEQKKTVLDSAEAGRKKLQK